MEEINVLSWGGGTQSTALLIKMLKGEIVDEKSGEVIKPDYIIFSDTKNEANFVYSQIYKVKEWVKKHYNYDIIITARNKEQLTDDEVIKMIKSGSLNKYRNSKYADLYQSHILYLKGLIKSIDIMPLWTRDKKTGKVGKTKFKQCTFEYKITQVMREIRSRKNIKSFNKNKHHINFYIGYTVDEISRVKTNPKSYATNKFPLVDMYWSREMCIEYVEKELGFKPLSSVCNICYANDFSRVLKIYREDKKGWEKLIKLDEAMKNKPKDHVMINDLFMFRWQAILNIRLKNIDMEQLNEQLKDKHKQLNIFETEEAMACMGGCFL